MCSAKLLTTECNKYNLKASTEIANIVIRLFRASLDLELAGIYKRLFHVWKNVPL